MRKSVLLPALAVAGGIVGLLVRRVYLANGFEVGTGLPIAGAPSLWAVALVAVAVVVVLAVLSAGKHRNFDRRYAEAFLPRSPLCLTFQLAGVVPLAIGGFLALAHWVQSPVTDLGQRTVSIAWAGLGILALLAATGIYFVTLKMRRGQPILTAWVTLPGFAGCLWIMSNYYESWAANPVLGQYLIPMLGALLSMLACFFMGALPLRRAGHRHPHPGPGRGRPEPDVPGRRPAVGGHRPVPGHDLLSPGLRLRPGGQRRPAGGRPHLLGSL